MNPVPPALLDFIREGQKFIIAGHQEPDGDCAGSQLTLASVLGRMGKESFLCSAGPFKRTEIIRWKDRFAAEVPPEFREGARVIIVDFGSPERTGEVEPFLRDLPLAVIDHHLAARGEFSPAAVRFVDAGAPSVTFLIALLVEALGEKLTPAEAEFLFLGLGTDTGWFRHVEGAGADTFRSAAALVEAGANPKKVWHDIYGGKSLGSRNLAGIVLARAEAHYDGKLVSSWEEYEETQKYGAEGRDSDAVYQLLMSTGGVEAVVLVRQETPEKCAVGLRSRERADVAGLARRFGGGGHKNAAGVLMPGKIREILPLIIQSFGEIL